MTLFVIKKPHFTPDLLLSDVTGSEIHHNMDEGGKFKFEPCPEFANIVLADEINCAPAKFQTALLEAMEERQVNVDGQTFKMPDILWRWRHKTQRSKK